MATFNSADGTRLAYHPLGAGTPLICVPGGPMLPSAYFGDLGGLPAVRSLILMDLRGTGGSDAPADPTSVRCDRLVDDVEALRQELGLDRIDLLGHSAGAAVAVRYAAAHPDRIDHLVLATPSPMVVGLDITNDHRRRVAELRRGEEWFPEALAALERIWSGTAGPADRDAITPFWHGRWDEAAKAQAAREAELRDPAAAGPYYAEGAVDPPSTRSALAGLSAPVLLIAGEYDLALPPANAAEYAALFPSVQLAVLTGGGHSPWLDDPGWFVQTVARFLGS